jgi:hypothetical protein
VNVGLPNWLVGFPDGSSIRTGRMWLGEKVDLDYPDLARRG